MSNSPQPKGKDGRFVRTRETRHPKHRGYVPAVPVAPDKLTADEERYALALFEAGDKAKQYEVYLEVFPDRRDKPYATIHTRASLLATKVRLRVQQLKDAVAAPLVAEAIVTEQRIREELARLAFTDLADFMEWGPEGVKVKEASELTPAQRSAVAEVSQTVTKDGGTIRFKLYDKQKALEALAARVWPVPKDAERPSGPVTNIQYNVTFVTRSRDGDNAPL